MLSFDADDGSLTLDLAAIGAGRLRLGGWASGLVARHVDGEVFDGDLGIPLRMLERSGEPGVRWVEAIPEPVRRALAPFSWRQWLALRLVRAEPRALELAATAPTLFACLLEAIGADRVSLVEAEGLVLARRRAILARLGLPSAEWAVRLLARVRFVRHLPDAPGHARALLAHEGLVATLRRSPGLVIGESLRMFVAYPDLARLPFALGGDELLDAAGALRPDAAEAFLGVLRLARPALADLLAMMRELARPDVERTLAGLRSYAELRALHDRHAQVVNALDDRLRVTSFRTRWGTNAFPPAPVPASAVVTPIATYEELLKEGRDMRHCVASYAEAVMDGRCYIYRVLGPERATLELGLAHGRQPVVAQLRLEGNARPSKPTFDAVERWLRAAQGESPPAVSDRADADADSEADAGDEGA